jgi:mRNA interferase MazF
MEVRSARLPKRSWAKLGQIRTLSVERLGARMGAISPDDLADAVQGLLEIAG